MVGVWPAHTGRYVLSLCGCEVRGYLDNQRGPVITREGVPLCNYLEEEWERGVMRTHSGTALYNPDTLGMSLISEVS